MEKVREIARMICDERARLVVDIATLDRNNMDG